MNKLIVASLAVAWVLCGSAPVRAEVSDTDFESQLRCESFAAAKALVAPGDGDFTIQPAASSPKKSVALVVHGLNTRPEKMGEIASLLNGGGMDTVSVTLSGHHGDLEQFRNVNRRKWLVDLLKGYCAARALADEQKVPLVFSGFSLGALLTVDLMTGAPAGSIRFDRMVLLAPSLSVHTATRMVRVLESVSTRMVLPSMNNRDYRANQEGTSVAAYAALFESLRRAERHDFPDLPVLIFVDPQDELVSASGLQELVSSRGLKNWKVLEISNAESTLNPSYHHLIIDRASLGERVWTRVSELMNTFLLGQALPEKPAL